MGHEPATTFDEWVDFCVREGLADKRRSTQWRDIAPDPESLLRLSAAEPPHEMFEQSEDPLHTLDAPTVAEFMLRLFRSPAFLIDRYSAAELDALVKFIFSGSSSYFDEIRDAQIPQRLLIDIHRAVAVVYTDLLDPVCARLEPGPWADPRNDDSICGTVYAIWELDQIFCALFPRDAHPDLHEPCFEALEAATLGCRSNACKFSGLHGLGHLVDTYPRQAGRIIGRYLDRPNEPEHVVEYAVDASTGSIL